MPPHPPKLLEWLASLLIPPACREEVLGDLRERYRNPAHYLVDLISTVPLLILGRMRRNTDAQFFVMQAALIYGSFLTAAWYQDRTLLLDGSGLLRLAIPAGLTFLYLLVRDVFSGGRTLWERTRFFVIEVFVLGLCGFLRLASPAVLYGIFWSLALVSTMRMMFEYGASQSRAAAVPAPVPNQRPQRAEVSRAAKFAQDAAITMLCLAAAAGLIAVMPKMVYVIIVFLAWAAATRFFKFR